MISDWQKHILVITDLPPKSVKQEQILWVNEACLIASHHIAMITSWGKQSAFYLVIASRHVWWPGTDGCVKYKGSQMRDNVAYE